MKPTFRVIAKLDIKDENLVKGINYEGLRVIGHPHEFATHYYENGIDEIFYQDVIASLLGRNTLNNIIAKSSRNIFVPITVGGGIKSLKNIEIILKSGADRVSINSGALENKSFISDSIKNFGSSNIIFSMEIIKSNNQLNIVKYNGREKTKYNLQEWLNILSDSGASEVFLSSVNNDGTGKGIDFDKGDHASTFGGNNLSCAAANATIEFIINNKLMENASKQGNYFMKKLNELKNKYSVIKEVRGKGLRIGVE